MIARQYQPSSRPDQPRQLVKDGGLQNAPRRMTVFRPGIGEQYIGAGQHIVVHAAKDKTHIIIPDTDIINAAILDVAEQTGDTIDERLGTNEPGIRSRGGNGGQTLAATKTDFKEQVFGRPIELRCRGCGRIKTEFGKARIQKLLHGDPKFPATPSAVEMRRLRPRHRHILTTPP